MDCLKFSYATTAGRYDLMLLAIITVVTNLFEPTRSLELRYLQQIA